MIVIIFDWYILLNVDTLTDSPNGTHIHVFTTHGLREVLFVSCWPVRRSGGQVSPFTSNFTSDVTQTRGSGGGGREGGREKREGREVCSMTGFQESI